MISKKWNWTARSRDSFPDQHEPLILIARGALMKNRRTWLGAVVCCGALVLAGLTPGANAQRGRRGGGGEGFSFRFLGPAAGNRVAAVAGAPGDPSLYYAGGSSGGVW